MILSVDYRGLNGWQVFFFTLHTEIYVSYEYEYILYIFYVFYGFETALQRNGAQLKVLMGKQHNFATNICHLAVNSLNADCQRY